MRIVFRDRLLNASKYCLSQILSLAVRCYDRPAMIVELDLKGFPDARERGGCIVANPPCFFELLIDFYGFNLAIRLDEGAEQFGVGCSTGCDKRKEVGSA